MITDDLKWNRMTSRQFDRWKQVLTIHTGTLMNWMGIFSYLDAKVEAMISLFDAFGNCSTRLNQNASRFTMLFTLDYDSSGMLTSGSLQVCGNVMWKQFLTLK